jgi:hypothetical protein
MIFTLEHLKKIQNGSVIRTIITAHHMRTDGYLGRMIFVVKKGYAEDWCIYYCPEPLGELYASRNGAKLIGEEIIKFIFPCDDEVYSRYRY